MRLSPENFAMQKPVQAWTKPELVRLGKIADVAAASTGPNQCGPSPCTNKS